MKILYKAIVFDLDDTLWKGTLSEDGVNGIIKKQKSKAGIPYISFMRFIRLLTDELGIFVAVCSRNDSTLVSDAIDKLSEELFPLKGKIDCIVANDNDKSKNLEYIAKDLSILPGSMIFIDDNKLIRNEVRSSMPDVFVPDWKTHEELTTTLIAGCFFDRKNISLRSKNRRRQLRIIKVEREKNTLPALSVRSYNDDGHHNACELFAASNQFNFSQKNRDFPDSSISIGFELYLDENREDLGLCSAITYSITSSMMTIYNWAMSCRFFEIGVEEMVLLYIKQTAGNRSVRINFQDSSKNKRVNKLLEKYPNLFSIDIMDGYVEVLYNTPEIIEELENNTNIKVK